MGIKGFTEPSPKRSEPTEEKKLDKVSRLREFHRVARNFDGLKPRQRGNPGAGTDNPDANLPSGEGGENPPNTPPPETPENPPPVVDTPPEKVHPWERQLFGRKKGAEA